MGLSRTVSEINGDFSQKSYLMPPLKGFPWELGIVAWGQKLEWWGYRVEKEV